MFGVAVVVVMVLDMDTVLNSEKKNDVLYEISKIDIRWGTEDQSLTGIGGTIVVADGIWRLRSLPIAAGTILWSLPALVDDNEGPVEWLLLEMITVGSTKNNNRL